MKIENRFQFYQITHHLLNYFFGKLKYNKESNGKKCNLLSTNGKKPRKFLKRLSIADIFFCFFKLNKYKIL